MNITSIDKQIEYNMLSLSIDAVFDMSQTSKSKYSNMPFSRRSLAIACIRGREAVVSRFKDLLLSVDLTEQQWRVMRIVYDEAPISGSVLSQLSCIHKASMSRIFLALEKRKLIQRVSSDVDGRLFIIKLTARGKKFMDITMPKADEIYHSIIQDFGEDKYLELMELLGSLSEINSKEF